MKLAVTVNPATGELEVVQGNGVDSLSVTAPLTTTGGLNPTIGITKADATHNGYLSSIDWTTFNNKLDSNFGNYISNPDAEVDTSGWNLYNDSGNTVNAYAVIYDLTFTAVAAGNAGNGINIDYVFHATQSYLTPLVTVVSPTHVTIAWYNGPSVANNPTATQVKAAWDAVPGAVALATVAITGTASNKQYITGAHLLGNGGDAAPVNGTGGVTSGVTFTRNTSTPLVGTASFDLGKIASNEQGQGVSTDFIINTLDVGQRLQITFAYQGSSGMVLGTSSDVRVFVYDTVNNNLIAVTPLQTLTGPVSTPKTFTGVFQTSPTSNTYRLILHIATSSATAWDLLLDEVTVNNQVTAGTVVQVPSVVLTSQPISGAVTDHMCVMWKDGATQWVPATIAGVALPTFGDDQTQAGFATNIVGSTADIYVKGAMDGFSFGPFSGYAQYIDNTTGAISPLPAPFTDLWVQAGMAVSSTVLNIDFVRHVSLIANSSGVPIKGGLLTSSAINDGTGDLPLSPGTNGNTLVANSAATLGLSWLPAVVVAAPFTYTTATRTLAVSSQTANQFYAAPNGLAGVPSFRAIVAADIPTLNQNTTGSAAKWTTARLLANNSVDGSANVAFANKFIVQGTTDAGLSGAQFLGALATGILKNTTTTGVLSIAVAADFPTLNQNTTGSAASFTGALAGDVTGTQGATAISSTTVTGKLITGYVSGAGTVSASDTILQAIQKLNGNTLALTSTSISNASGVSGTTVTDALNTLNAGTGTFTPVNLRVHSATATVTSSLSLVTYTTSDFNNGGGTYTTGVYTVPSGGKYQVMASLSLTAATAAAGNNYDIIIRKNGVEVARNKFVVGAATQKPNTVVVSDLLSCSASDTIDIQASAAGTTPSINASTTLNILTINKTST